MARGNDTSALPAPPMRQKRASKSGRRSKPPFWAVRDSLERLRSEEMINEVTPSLTRDDYQISWKKKEVGGNGYAVMEGKIRGAIKRLPLPGSKTKYPVFVSGPHKNRSGEEYFSVTVRTPYRRADVDLLIGENFYSWEDALNYAETEALDTMAQYESSVLAGAEASVSGAEEARRLEKEGIPVWDIWFDLNRPTARHKTNERPLMHFLSRAESVVEDNPRIGGKAFTYLADNFHPARRYYQIGGFEIIDLDEITGGRSNGAKLFLWSVDTPKAGAVLDKRGGGQAFYPYNSEHGALVSSSGKFLHLWSEMIDTGAKERRDEVRQRMIATATS